MPHVFRAARHEGSLDREKNEEEDGAEEHAPRRGQAFGETEEDRIGRLEEPLRAPALLFDLRVVFGGELLPRVAPFPGVQPGHFFAPDRTERRADELDPVFSAGHD